MAASSAPAPGPGPACGGAPSQPWAALAQDYGCPLTAEQMAEQETILVELFGEPAGGPVPWAGWPDVSDHDHGGPGGAGFVSGSALDLLVPGPALSAALDDTLAAGLGGLTDDALAGVILAARRCESRAAAQMLAAVAELDRRREATGDPRLVEYTDTEVSASRVVHTHVEPSSFRSDQPLGTFPRVPASAV